ncbi:MAG TPA: MSMEG_3727 family PQQ-associated protein [Thermoanaerobaculia bacterium]
MRTRLAAVAAAALLLTSCEYVRLLRPSVLKQLNPRVVRLVNELPNVDEPNKAIVARLFAHGGLSRAQLGDDGVFRSRIYVPKNQYIWYPAIVTMARGGDLELEFSNDDVVTHAAFVPSDGDRQLLTLPVGTSGKVRVTLNQPGLYWFGCPISNHAGRGMLGLVIVKGETPPEGRLDRPKQRRP